MGKRLLEPPGIETRGIRADQTAGVRDAADISSHVASGLPERSDMEGQTLYELGLAEVDIERAADAAPVRDVTSAIIQKVVYRNEIENGAGALEGISSPAPIAQHVRAVSPPCG